MACEGKWVGPKFGCLMILSSWCPSNHHVSLASMHCSSLEIQRVIKCSSASICSKIWLSPFCWNGSLFCAGFSEADGVFFIQEALNSHIQFQGCLEYLYKRKHFNSMVTAWKFSLYLSRQTKDVISTIIHCTLFNKFMASTFSIL